MIRHRGRSGLCIIAAAAAAAFVTAPRAEADSVSDFYRGRSITLIIGYSAGGGYDLYARTLARHMGRHIPGNPTFIPQNMAGAGSLNAANYLFNIAPKDGTAFGTFARGLPMEPLIGTARVMFEAPKFNWIGSGTNELSVCATWHTSPVKTWDDMLNKPFTVGGEGAGSDPDTFSALLKNVFGSKLRLITGYGGTSEIVLAIERGEVDGRCGWSWSSIKALRPSWISEKKLNVLVQLGLEKSEELAQVPLIMDFATERQRQILKMVLSRQVVGRPFAAPPAIPEDRKAALRAAFDDTMRDAAFLEDARKSKLEVNPVSGAQIDKLLGELYHTPKDVVDEARAAIAP